MSSEDASASGNASAEQTAERLHSAAIHLLRRLRREDDASGLSAPRLSALSVIVYGGPLTPRARAGGGEVPPPPMTPTGALPPGCARGGGAAPPADDDADRRRARRAPARGARAKSRRWPRDPRPGHHGRPALAGGRPHSPDLGPGPAASGVANRGFGGAR